MIDKLNLRRKLNSEAGLTLLEVLAVVGILGLIGTTLGAVMLSQYESWEFTSGRLQLLNEADLITAYLERDTLEAGSFYLQGESLYLQQDRSGDGTVDRTVAYSSDGEGHFSRLVSYGSHLPRVEDEEYTLSSTPEAVNFSSPSRNELLVEATLEAGERARKIEKSYYVSDAERERGSGGNLDLQGKSSYVALDSQLDRDGYRELTLAVSLEIGADEELEDSGAAGVIYGFDDNEYFNLEVDDNGRLCLNINSGSSTYHISSNTVLTPGEIYTAAVTLDKEGDMKIYINGELDTSAHYAGLSGGYGSGNTRYGFIGTDSQATSFDGGHTDNYFSGRIYWLQYWNRALTEGQLEIYTGGNISGEEQGLLSFYRFAKNDPVVYDSVGNGHGLRR